MISQEYPDLKIMSPNGDVLPINLQEGNLVEVKLQDGNTVVGYVVFVDDYSLQISPRRTGKDYRDQYHMYLGEIDTIYVYRT